jgi:hypothetical protein
MITELLPVPVLEAVLDGEAIARRAMQTPAQKTVDKMQAAMKRLPQVDCPLVHRFTPGLYVREIFMPKGTFIISKIHKTEHPFIVSKGHVAVWIEGVGVVEIKAPYCGVTKAGTRRILYIREDCVWTTFHPTDKTDVNEIEKDVIFNAETDESVEISAETMKLLKEENL